MGRSVGIGSVGPASTRSQQWSGQAVCVKQSRARRESSCNGSFACRQVIMVDQGSDPGLREAAEQASEALTGCCDEGLVACIRARARCEAMTCLG